MLTPCITLLGGQNENKKWSEWNDRAKNGLLGSVYWLDKFVGNLCTSPSWTVFFFCCELGLHWHTHKVL